MHDSASALRRDRWIVVAALLLITALALGYTFWLATGFDMSGMMAAEYVPWSATYFAFMLTMWVVMMVGMMTPTVAPMVLLYAAVARQSAGRLAFAPPAWFFAGYLLAWCGFALLATLLQWLLERLALITPMMAGTSRLLGAFGFSEIGAHRFRQAEKQDRECESKGVHGHNSTFPKEKIKQTGYRFRLEIIQ